MICSLEASERNGTHNGSEIVVGVCIFLFRDLEYPVFGCSKFVQMTGDGMQIPAQRRW